MDMCRDIEGVLFLQAWFQWKTGHWKMSGMSPNFPLIVGESTS